MPYPRAHAGLSPLPPSLALLLAASVPAGAVLQSAGYAVRRDS